MKTSLIGTLIKLKTNELYLPTDYFNCNTHITNQHDVNY